MKKENKKVKMIRGEVVSDKMDKTRVMRIEMRWRHPLFGKSILRSRRVKFHDEKNQSQLGDIVSAVETRPLSKQKRHRLLEIIEKAK